ncbi:MAG TPA: ATP-binding protein [Candidatus Angelobacter sp.]|nr:ATP-binding protein [Candidatus Angelobacter sp.]
MQGKKVAGASRHQSNLGIVEPTQQTQALRDDLSAELAAMTKQQELSTSLLSRTHLQFLLDEILDATIELQNADFGNVQLYDSETRAFEIVAQRGFKQDFLDYFRSINDTAASYGRVLVESTRVIIEDVECDPRFEPHRAIAAAAGFRAVQSTPLFTRSGKPLGMLSTHFRQPHRPSERQLRLTDLYARQAADMIEQKHNENLLRQSEERFRLLVEAAQGHAFFSLDSEGRVSSWNAGAEQLKGYHANEIMGQHCARFYLREDAEQGKPQAELEIAAREGRYESDGWRQRKDGSRFWAHIVTTALRNSQQQLIGFSRIVRDLTEWKRAEEAKDAARKELARVARINTLGGLTAAIAHEINQPLSVIVTNINACTRLLSTEQPDLEEVRRAMTDIAGAATRASEVISRVRAFLRRDTVTAVPVVMERLIREALSHTQIDLEKHKILVKTELTHDLPLVLGDPVVLQQVVVNLVGNAIDAMSSVPDHSRILRMQLVARTPEEVLVVIEDSGSGLIPQDTERVFDPFFTTKPGGLGFGLPISRSIIENHGGRLWATSNPGGGATFQFTLPVAR